MLLKEALSRGEKLYRLSFRISDDEAMKYPRAYLAVSNLEQIFNVIKVDPEPERIDDSGKEKITVILTASRSNHEIVEEINIDQLVDIKIEKLSFDEELVNPYIEAAENEQISELAELVDVEEMDTEPIILPRDRVISVDAEEIDAISAYVSEIKSRLTDITSAVSTSSGEDTINYDLAGLEKISNSIEGMMNNIKTVDFFNHFAGYKRTVRDIASELGKKAELTFTGESVRIQRDFADFIADPMLHVLRNAIVHGIEAPEQRGNKPEKGSVSIETVYENDSLVIRISDDGAGIDMDLIPDEYGNITTNEQLLELLVQPGYTTLTESDKFGGRGVGLDLVANRIKTRGGRLELSNRRGFGCEFRLIFKGFKIS